MKQHTANAFMSIVCLCLYPRSAAVAAALDPHLSSFIKLFLVFGLATLQFFVYFVSRILSMTLTNNGTSQHNDIQQQDSKHLQSFGVRYNYAEINASPTHQSTNQTFESIQQRIQRFTSECRLNIEKVNIIADCK